MVLIFPLGAGRGEGGPGREAPVEPPKGLREGHRIEAGRQGGRVGRLSAGQLARVDKSKPEKRQKSVAVLYGDSRLRWLV
ncbi:hypothetical protein E2C01_045472 [Portunus trituberculatus]|uniref:Uncharacterized protein n=1 Tax=Portunus trituberculatus TaxID=210409 RepID=A0A5B7FVW3_PORTR|nr:hypothetical protein [Portunus trituberculatus]